MEAKKTSKRRVTNPGTPVQHAARQPAPKKTCYTARWKKGTITLSVDQYRVAMSEVERIRWSACENNAYGRLKEGDEDWQDPYGCKLSDILATALDEGTRLIGTRTTVQARLAAGLRQIQTDEPSQCSPCEDEDADDVFHSPQSPKG